ncbi:MAG: hypothetical protein NXI32_22220 [bacterium]|nr:hypothetical protein [bacterium]
MSKQDDVFEESAKAQQHERDEAVRSQAAKLAQHVMSGAMVSAHDVSGAAAYAANRVAGVSMGLVADVVSDTVNVIRAEIQKCQSIDDLRKLQAKLSQGEDT